MQQQNTGHTPSVWNKYWISDRCLVADDIQSVEYRLVLGSTMCSIRYKEDRILEMYFFDRTSDMKILSIEEHKYNRYIIKDEVIYRDDGMQYINTDSGVLRLNDKRSYTQMDCIVTDLPDRVYTAYYFLYNSIYLKGYIENHIYDVDKMNVQGLQALLRDINMYKPLDLSCFVREKLFIKED